MAACRTACSSTTALGTFTDETLARLTWQDNTTMSVSVGDVDGDGDQDIVCGNIGSIFSGRRTACWSICRASSRHRCPT